MHSSCLQSVLDALLLSCSSTCSSYYIWVTSFGWVFQTIPFNSNVCATFCKFDDCLRWGVLSPTSYSQIDGSLIASCPRLLIQYIHTYPPYLEAVSSIRNLRMPDAMVTRSPYNMACLIWVIEIIYGKWWPKSMKLFGANLMWSVKNKMPAEWIPRSAFGFMAITRYMGFGTEIEPKHTHKLRLKCVLHNQ
jgi:hypothetical protein